MRIISDFHDYYDIGLAYGTDPKCVYARNEEEFLFRGLTGSNPAFLRSAMADEVFGGVVSSLRDHSRWERVSGPDETAILFCGRLYLAMSVGDTWCYSFGELIDALRGKGEERAVAKLLEEQRNRSRSWFLPGYHETSRAFEAAEELNGRKAFLDGILVEAGAPIVAFEHRYGDVKAIVNPELKHYGFARVMDPYTAFQELSMYMTNVIGIPENPMCEVDDASKAAKHGYDKFSFRHPTKL